MTSLFNFMLCTCKQREAVHLCPSSAAVCIQLFLAPSGIYDYNDCEGNGNQRI